MRRCAPTARRVHKARSHTSERVVAHLAERVNGRLRIRRDPPIVVPLADLVSDTDSAVIEEDLRRFYEGYRESLPDAQRCLLSHYEITDIARKVVGVGSVGTRAFIVLLLGRTDNDALVLQFKEAGASVLEPRLGPSRFPTSGERVVQGQRLMQAVSDIFLGWSTSATDQRSYYWRQLQDMKGSADLATISERGLSAYGQLCGWSLARAQCAVGFCSRDRRVHGHEPSLRPRDRVIRKWIQHAERSRLHGPRRRDRRWTRRHPARRPRGAGTMSIERIAREGLIYGYASVDLYRIRHDFALDPRSAEFKAPLNSFGHARGVASAQDRTVVAMNVDTPYSYAWLNLQPSPSLSPFRRSKRSVTSQRCSSTSTRTSSATCRRVPDDNRGGRFLVTGPGWDGEAAPGINGVISCPTALCLVFLRTQLLGPEDVDHVSAIQDQCAVQPLSTFLDQPSPPSRRSRP